MSEEETSWGLPPERKAKIIAMLDRLEFLSHQSCDCDLGLDDCPACGPLVWIDRAEIMLSEGLKKFGGDTNGW